MVRSAAPLAVTSAVAYAMFDGLFQHALISHLAGHASAARDLEVNVPRVLESLIAYANRPPGLQELGGLTTELGDLRFRGFRGGLFPG
jgi:hypothetical protein